MSEYQTSRLDPGQSVTRTPEHVERIRGSFGGTTSRVCQCRQRRSTSFPETLQRLTEKDPRTEEMGWMLARLAPREESTEGTKRSQGREIKRKGRKKKRRSIQGRNGNSDHRKLHYHVAPGYLYNACTGKYVRSY
ncbi:hypothetical protein IF2G_04703 [Cordyceps javanica]|nr:hypothetical protein IF2G_04703 [Cordyceps javanica]